MRIEERGVLPRISPDGATVAFEEHATPGPGVVPSSYALRVASLPGGRPVRWVPGGDDVAFARGLLAQYNVTVLPGSLLAREANGINPGVGRVRLALVAERGECLEAAQRIAAFARSG